ncbi:MAG: type II toxin-antitoxin system VapC family toxin [Candidatus Sulfotelmatobacter sp.]
MKVDDIEKFVLDASITLAWCFPEEATAGTERLLDLLANGGSAITPAIWPYEVANALLVGERRKPISMAQVTSVLRRISELPIMVDPIRVERAFDQVLSFARQEQLSEYDAAYLELALREAVPIATLDDGLRRAAQRAGIQAIRL